MPAIGSVLKKGAKKQLRRKLGGKQVELNSAEGYAVLIVALGLDFIQPVIATIFTFVSPGSGVMISWIGDFIGTISLGPWLYFRGTPPGPQRRFFRFLWRRGLAILSEYIPFLGRIVPVWTFLVWRSLKK